METRTPAARRLPSRASCLAVSCAVLCLGLHPTPGAILSSNLDQPIDGVEQFTNARWLASQFSTNGVPHLVDGITLRLQQIARGGVEVAIFDDAGGQPGKMVALLGAGGVITDLPGNVTFTGGQSRTKPMRTTVGVGQLNEMFDLPPGISAASFLGDNAAVTLSGDAPDGIFLEAETDYWVVTRATGGQYSSAYTDSETGSGEGFSSNWAVSQNAGSTWLPRTLSPLFLGLDASPSAPVLLLEFRTDAEAIASLIFSGLPTALVQRDALFAAVRDVTGDVNTRLFRLRSGLSPATRGPEIFVTGAYGSADSNTFQPAAGFQTDTLSATAGVEYRFNDWLAVGAAYSRLETDVGFGLGLGDTEITGDHVTGYLSGTWRGFYADFLYSHGSYDHEIRRDTLFFGDAHGAPDAETHTFQINLGYSFEVAKFMTGPFASLDYTTGDLGGYTESANAGAGRLEFKGQNFDTLVSRVGWQLSRTFEATSDFRVTPQIRAGWARENRNRSETVEASLVRSPFSVGFGDQFDRVGKFGAGSRTPDRDDNAIEAGVAVGATWRDRVSLTLDYATRVWEGDNVAHSIAFTGSFKF